MKPSQPQPPEDDGLIVMQRMTPDQFDVVLGSHPDKRTRTTTKNTGSLISAALFLALMAAVIYLVVQMFHTPKPKPAVLAPPPAAEVFDAPLPQTPAPEIRTTEQVVYVAPKLETAQSAASKTLDDCLKDGNVIDRDVINCRFGDPQAVDYNAPRPQGMVSDRYMAQYKATATRTSVDTGRHYAVAGVFIREVDGRNRYEARYRIYNNHVENSSVCMNFKGDSVEYRECRRAAAPYFKEMCSDWTKRVAKDKDEKNKLAQEQYCEAATTYQP